MVNARTTPGQTDPGQTDQTMMMPSGLPEGKGTLHSDIPDDKLKSLKSPAQSNKQPHHKADKGVALVAGSSPDFTHETNSVLKGRLQQTAMLLCCGFLAFLLKGLIVDSHDYLRGDWIIMGIFACVTAMYGVLASRLYVGCFHALSHLRGVEILIFGSAALLFLAAGYNNLVHASKEGYLVSTNAPWSMLIFTYALFIPNRWQRAARYIVPMALGPIFVVGMGILTSAEVREFLMRDEVAEHTLLDMLLGMGFTTAVAITGVGMISGLRTQAFEAKQLGQYKLKKLLGRGGMGEVYLAEHLMLKRPCAIKTIRPEKAGDPATLARFEQEVQATAKLTHWNTVEIYDFGRTDDGSFYYVMEYLPGMSLDHIVEMYGPLEPSRLIYLFSQVTDALEEAHAHLLVHRDIKPANIFAAKRGGNHDVAKLLDFGLVRSLQQDISEHLTQENIVTGSPLYMSPEQARGDEVDGRSDIYALGASAYYLLSGRPPFEDTAPVKLLLAHATQTPKPLHEVNPEVPRDLSDIVMRCLAKDANERPQTVRDLHDMLNACENAQDWNRDQALSWWSCNGCQHKLQLDHQISQGLDALQERNEETMLTASIR